MSGSLQECLEGGDWIVDLGGGKYVIVNELSFL